MNAEVEVQNSIASTLPEGAIVSFEGKQYVFALKTATEFEMVEF